MRLPSLIAPGQLVLNNVSETLKTISMKFGMYNRKMAGLDVNVVLCFYPMEKLEKLRQDGSVQAYCDRFELLRSYVDLSEVNSLRYFVNGLKDEIREPVQLFAPHKSYPILCHFARQVTRNVY